MTAGETILKFTDYPFAYSIVGIALGMIGFSFGQNQIIFLGIAGAFGTLLATTDPIGFMIRKLEANYLKKKLTKDSNLEYFFYQLGALKTKAISFEIEKMIGTFYFILSIIGFVLAIVIPTPFFDKLMLKDQSGNPLLDELYLKTVYLGLSAIAIGILAPRARRFWKELDGQVDTAVYHMTAISNDNATQTSVENMTRAIEQNDWELAYLWRKKIEEEILYKKGKRELIIKSADMVYSPLHKEANDFEYKRKQIPFTKRYPSFDHNEWDKIKQFSHQSIIDETNLRHRIDSFYNVMYEFNEQLFVVNRKILEIINKHCSVAFGRPVSMIMYDVYSEKGGGGEVDMIGCVLFNVHPLKFYGTEGNARHLAVVSNGNTSKTDIKEEYEKFDSAWPKIIEEAQLNAEVQKLQHSYSVLKMENEKLMKIYSEKIEMQWKV